jgi:hypothetical protein
MIVTVGSTGNGVVSPPILAGQAGGLKLRLGYLGSTGGVSESSWDASQGITVTTYVSASVGVSAWDGSQWVVLSNPTTLIAESGWFVQEYDLSAYRQDGLQIKVWANIMWFDLDWVMVYDPTKTQPTVIPTTTPSPTFTSTPPPYNLPFIDPFTSNLGWTGYNNLTTVALVSGSGGDNDGKADWVSGFMTAPVSGYPMNIYSPSINAASASTLKLRFAGWNINKATVEVFDGSTWIDLQDFGGCCSFDIATGLPEGYVASKGTCLVNQGTWSVWEFDLSAYKNPALQVMLGSWSFNGSFILDWVHVYDPTVTSQPVFPTFTISPTPSVTTSGTSTVSPTPSPTFSATPSRTPTGSITTSPTATASPTPSISPTVTRTAICPRHGTVRICPNPAEDNKAHFYFDLHGPCTAHVVLRNSAAAQVATASAHLSLADPSLTLRLGKLARGLYYYSIELDYDDGSRESVQQGKFYKL